ncbi:arsenate reductase family protein [Robiginitomaculum antarcticum]|uniref:arsenate reductase family protein n=1 Tax=Robiginitomaculum antarcticum TaxID=437507 RepID=UPI000380E65C|nr:arsenate reductase family protein [Robiginitomaculum antarcticum]
MVVIHHNPKCETSRNVLAIIRGAGYDPVVIDYLSEGWTRPQLLALFAVAGLTPSTALRVTKSPAKDLGLLGEGVCEDDILAQMLEHPVLVNRPIVCSPKGVKLCRPSEAVLDLLETKPKGPFYKEGGEMLIDETGQVCA